MGKTSGNFKVWMKKGQGKSIETIITVVIVLTVIVLLMIIFFPHISGKPIKETINNELAERFPRLFGQERQIDMYIKHFEVEPYLGDTIKVQWMITEDVEDIISYKIVYKNTKGDTEELNIGDADKEDGIYTLIAQIPTLDDFTLTLEYSIPDGKSDSVKREVKFSETFDSLSFQYFGELNRFFMGKLIAGEKEVVFEEYNLAKNHIIVGFNNGNPVDDNCKPRLGLGVGKILPPEVCEDKSCICLCYTKGTNHQESCIENGHCFSYEEIDYYSSRFKTSNSLSRLQRGKLIPESEWPADIGEYYLALYGDCKLRYWNGKNRPLKMERFDLGGETGVRIAVPPEEEIIGCCIDNAKLPITCSPTTKPGCQTGPTKRWDSQKCRDISSCGGD